MDPHRRDTPLSARAPAGPRRRTIQVVVWYACEYVTAKSGRSTVIIYLVRRLHFTEGWHGDGDGRFGSGPSDWFGVRLHRPKRLQFSWGFLGTKYASDKSSTMCLHLSNRRRSIVDVLPWPHDRILLPTLSFLSLINFSHDCTVQYSIGLYCIVMYTKVYSLAAPTVVGHTLTGIALHCSRWHR